MGTTAGIVRAMISVPVARINAVAPVVSAVVSVTIVTPSVVSMAAVKPVMTVMKTNPIAMAAVVSERNSGNGGARQSRRDCQQ